MRKSKFRIIASIIALLGITLGSFGCSATKISDAIDLDLGTDTSNIAEQIDQYVNTDTSQIDYADAIQNAIESYTGKTDISEEENGLISDIPSDSSMYVHFIDVGQGDATLVICDGEAMLIDCGDNSIGTLLQNYLQKQGVEKLKYVIGTHPDADHIGGMDVILTKFDCERIFMPDIAKDTNTYRDVISAMEYKGYQNTLPYVGDIYSIGSAYFTILAPNSYDYGDKTNNYSIALLIKHGDNSFLFTGDAEMEAETDIISNGLSINADVIQIGHHGSSTSTTPDFLDKVNPSYAVISCGLGNDYGHPHAETLNRLRESGVSVYRTDEQGTIIAISNKDGITWSCAPSESWLSGR